MLWPVAHAIAVPPVRDAISVQLVVSHTDRRVSSEMPITAPLSTTAHPSGHTPRSTSPRVPVETPSAQVMGRILAVNHGLRLPVFPAAAVSSDALLRVPKTRSQQSHNNLLATITRSRKVAAIARSEVPAGGCRSPSAPFHFRPQRGPKWQFDPTAVEISDMECGCLLKKTPTLKLEVGAQADSDAICIGMGGVSSTGGPTLGGPTLSDIFSSRLAAPSTVRPSSRSRKRRPTYDVAYGRALSMEVAVISSVRPLSVPMQRSNPFPVEE